MIGYMCPFFVIIKGFIGFIDQRVKSKRTDWVTSQCQRHHTQANNSSHNNNGWPDQAISKKIIDKLSILSRGLLLIEVEGLIWNRANEHKLIK